jgi:hypothetical protein
MCKTKNDKKGTIGRTGVRLANHHHTKDALKEMNVKTFGQSELNGVIDCVVVKTFDDRAGSVAGLTYALKMHSIPFSFEECTYLYPESWMSTKKILKKCKLITSGPTTDNIPDGNKRWVFQTGYGDRVNTDRGVKVLQLQLNDKKGDANKQRKENRKGLLDRLIQWVIKVYNDIMSWFNTSPETESGTNQTDHNTGKDSHENKNKPNNGKRNKKKTTKNSAIYLSSINIAGSMAMGMQRSVKPNASTDIKKANRIISDMQLAKMQVRTGILGDKTFASSKRSDALNSYIVGTTSYNVNDSTITQINW